MSESEAAHAAPSDGATSAEERRPEEIREEIEETREELGDTVAAVTEKTDVKKQAQAKVEDVKAQAAAKAEEAQTLAKQNPQPLAIAGAVVGLLVLWRLLRR
jgi:chromosome segregation ATPase